MAFLDSIFEYPTEALEVRKKAPARASTRAGWREPADSLESALFETRLPPMARLAGVPDVEEFVDLLGMDRKRHLHRAEAEAKTIHETSFFRDGCTFGMLREAVLPELIARRRKERRL